LNTTDKPYFEGSDSICDYDKIYDLYAFDEISTVVPSIQYLLKNKIKVLLFAGDLDYVCSWMQMEDWLNKLEWPGAQQYVSMSYKEYIVNGRDVGKYKKVDNLAYFTIYEAGHEAMFEQPEAMLNLMNMMVDGVLFKE
jgi:cathepsin A (carboxypeptidase C)